MKILIGLVVFCFILLGTVSFAAADDVDQSGRICNPTGCVSVCFLVDGSGSVREGPFREALGFIVRLGQALGLSKYIQFAIISFGSSARQISPLTSDISALNESCEKAYYPNSTTNIEYGFIASKLLLQKADPKCRNLIIVMTDGNPTNAPRAMEENQKVKDCGIHVTSIAIGKDLNYPTVASYASDPSCAYRVANYSVLNVYLIELQKIVCEATAPPTTAAPTTTEAPTTTPTKPAPTTTEAPTTTPTKPPTTTPTKPPTQPTTTAKPCVATVPVVVCIIGDGSGSMGIDAYNKLLEVICNLLYGVKLNENFKACGNIFGTSVRPIGPPSSDAHGLCQKFKNVTYPGSTTETHKAYQTCQAYFDTFPSHFARAVILFTDGYPTSPSLAYEAAKNLSDKGCRIDAVGFGKYINEDGLQKLATDKGQVHKVADVTALSDLIQNLTKVVCEAPPPPAKPCNSTKPTVLCIALDSSGSISLDDYKRILFFIVALVRALKTSSDYLVSGTIFSTHIYEISPPTADKDHFCDLVLNATYHGGTTNTGGAIEQCRKYFSAYPDNYAKLMVIVTDGLPTNETDANKEARISRSLGIKPVIVGYGEYCSAQGLRNLTDSDDHVLYAKDAISVFPLIQKLITKVCEDDSNKIQ